MTTKKTEAGQELELELVPLDEGQAVPIKKPDQQNLPTGFVERRVRQRRVNTDRREVIRFSKEGDRRQLKDRRASGSVWEDGYEKT